jgi:glycosyltransferase involved in cell wall biosynthesis
LKVLHIINSLGDAGQYFIPFFKGLLSKGEQVYVVSDISPLMSKKLGALDIKHINLNGDNHNLAGLSPTNIGDVKRLFFIPLYFLRVLAFVDKEKIDLLHVHNDDLVPVLLGCTISKIRKLPIVLTIHGGPPSFARSLKPLHQIHGVIATSPEQRVGLNTKGRQVKVIPLPVDLNRFLFVPPSRQGGRKVVLVSRIDVDKIDAVYSVVQSALKLAEDFADVQVVIAGSGSMFSDVARKAAQVNEQIGRQVIVMAGFVEDTPGLMREASVVIGVGLVVIEAMASGKPVVVAGALKGSKGGCFGGIVNPSTVDALRLYNFSGRNSAKQTSAGEVYLSVSKILKDDKYAQELGVFGRRFVERSFGPERVAEKTELVYSFAITEAYQSGFPSLFVVYWTMAGVLTYQAINKISRILF